MRAARWPQLKELQAHDLLQVCGARPGAQMAAAPLERIDESGSSIRSGTLR
jgi:hypothetical protein